MWETTLSDCVIHTTGEVGCVRQEEVKNTHTWFRTVGIMLPYHSKRLNISPRWKLRFFLPPQTKVFKEKHLNKQNGTQLDILSGNQHNGD